MNDVATTILVVVLCLFGVGSCMWGYPKYRVYSQELSGKAVLAEAESSRQVAVREAMAIKESAKHKAEAEVIRAKGVAEANKIISDGLGGPEGYLRYLAIEAMKQQAERGKSTVVYIPTEGNIPITEATRFNKPLKQEPKGK